jgi:hypothetical protein
MKTVFECAFGVEAQLVSNLLRDAGIPNQVLGEFLQGAAGDLPVGRLVRVVVADGHADAARDVIARWDRALPVTEAALAEAALPLSEPEPAGAPGGGRPFLHILGVLLAAVVAALLLRALG